MLLLFLATTCLLVSNARAADEGIDETGVDADYELVEENVNYPVTLTETGFKYYKFSLPTQGSGDTQDFTVLAQATDYTSDPDIYLATDPGLSSAEDIDTAEFITSCTAYGYDICVLSAAKIKEKEYAYIAIRCYESCNISFRV